VFHQVLATLYMQLGMPHVVEVTIRRLQAVNIGVSRRLIAVPGVVGPQPPAQRFLGLHLAEGLIQKASMLLQRYRPYLPMTPSSPIPPRSFMVRVPAW